MVLATLRLGWAVCEATALTMLVLDINMIPPGVSRASMVSTDTGTRARDEVRNNEWVAEKSLSVTRPTPLGGAPSEKRGVRY